MLNGDLIQMKAFEQYFPLVRAVQFGFKLTYFAKDKCTDGIVGKGLRFVIGHSDIKISLSFFWPILMAFRLQKENIPSQQGPQENAVSINS